MSRFLNERFQSMEAYMPGAQPRARDIIKLNTNESPFPPSPKVEYALTGAAAGLNRYSDLTSAPLISALCAHNRVLPSQVMVGNGSDEILALSILAFGARGVRFPDITYGFYPVWADLFGLEKKIVPLASDFSLRAGDYRDDGAMILLANPNAPTGMAVSVGQIERILTNNPSCVVLVDEAYFGFGAESCARLLGVYENLLIVRTFSKSYALAGGRVGYALGSAPLIEDLNKIRFSFHPYNLGTLPMLAATAALGDEPYYEGMRARIVLSREALARALRPMGFSVTPSETNFVFAKHGRVSGERVQELLEARGIYVRRFDQIEISDYLRITIGNEEQMEALIGHMAELLREEGL